jgi:hypothetical protein
LAVAWRFDSGEHELRLLSWPALAELGAFPLELPGPGPESPRGWRLLISWSADDAWIVVSPDRSRGATEPTARVFNAADGSSFAFRGFEAFFIGTNELVAAPRADLNELGLDLFRVDSSGATRSDTIAESAGALCSDPGTGVFLSIEPPFKANLGVPIGPRTRTTGADLVGGVGSLETVLLRSR